MTLALFFPVSPSGHRAFWFFAHSTHSVPLSPSLSSKTSYITPSCWFLLYWILWLLQQWITQQAQQSKRGKNKHSLNYIYEGTTERRHIQNQLITRYQLSWTGSSILGHKTFIIKQPPWLVNLGCCFYSVIQICLLFMSKSNSEIENEWQEMFQRWPGKTPALFQRQAKSCFFHNLFIFLCLNSSEKKQGIMHPTCTIFMTRAAGLFPHLLWNWNQIIWLGRVKI